jgi:hypothetical protein
MAAAILQAQMRQRPVRDPQLTADQWRFVAELMLAGKHYEESRRRTTSRHGRLESYDPGITAATAGPTASTALASEAKARPV